MPIQGNNASYFPERIAGRQRNLKKQAAKRAFVLLAIATVTGISALTFRYKQKDTKQPILSGGKQKNLQEKALDRLPAPKTIELSEKEFTPSITIEDVDQSRQTTSSDRLPPPKTNNLVKKEFTPSTTIEEVSEYADTLAAHKVRKNCSLTAQQLKYFEQVYADKKFVFENFEKLDEIFKNIISDTRVNHLTDRIKTDYNNAFIAQAKAIIEKDGTIYTTLKALDKLMDKVPLGCFFDSRQPVMGQTRKYVKTKFVYENFEEIIENYKLCYDNIFKTVGSFDFIETITKRLVEQKIKELEKEKKSDKLKELFDEIIGWQLEFFTEISAIAAYKVRKINDLK
ncbi:MAG: hypothetical protein AAF335_02860 [Bacteroidota bacterium]